MTQTNYKIHCSYISTEVRRLDKYLSQIIDQLPFEVSRSQIEKIFYCAKVNGKEVKRSYKTHYKDEIYIELHAHIIQESSQHEKSLYTIDEKTRKKEIENLEIIYEDEHVLAINKARGLLVHPGAGEHGITLSQLIFHKLSSYREEDQFNNRAGIVHRLDKDTSGVILIAKTARSHDKLAKLFANRNIHKKYLALVEKEPRTRIGNIETYIGRHPHHRKKFSVVRNELKGKYAHTGYRVLWSNGKYSLLLCELFTGRTHQIRVHLKYIGCPVLGDSIYGNATTSYGDIIQSIQSDDMSKSTQNDSTVCNLMLHAYEVEFALNIHNELVNYHITAQLPHDMQKIISQLTLPIEL